jgi:hypothetical protein
MGSVILIRGSLWGRQFGSSGTSLLATVGFSTRLRRQGVGNLRGCSKSFCAEVSHGASGTRVRRASSGLVLGAITPVLSARPSSNFTPVNPQKRALGQPRIHATRRALHRSPSRPTARLKVVPIPKKALPEAVRRVFLQRIFYDPIGNTIRKTEPHPSWLVTFILPP